MANITFLTTYGNETLIRISETDTLFNLNYS